MEKPYIEIETEHFFIRSVAEADKSDYMGLRRQASEISAAYDIVPGFLDFEWEQELNSEDDLYLSVFDRDNNAFVASASIQAYRKQEAELGIDVVKERRRNGAGKEVLSAVLKKAHDMFPGRTFVTRINRKNAASRGLTEKCGGTFLRYDDSQFSKAVHVGLSDDEIKEDVRKLYEEGKDAVVIYRMP